MGGKVIFTKKPKNNLEEIFDRESEINQIYSLLKNYEWLMILGQRMSGKTSIALAVSNEFKKEKRKVIYVDLVGVKGASDLVRRLYSSIPKTFLDKIKDNLDALGIKIGSISISFKTKPISAFEYIIKTICDDTILILDEAQDLKQGINHLIPVFHELLNKCPKLSIIFTGSAIGLIKTIIEQEGQKPLAGRKPIEILLKPWSRETAEEYLTMGLNECNVNYTRTEINEVIDTFGTLPGWINVYGINRCIKPHEAALKDSLDEAIGIALSELKNIAEENAWRIKALKLLSIGASWSEILRETNVSTETLSNFLNKLERLYLINKEGRNYHLIDPVYRKAVNFL
ncbi:AAA family ATPase [Acidianus sulfidivorans JP7]|uniref:ATPase domain-containing protein n=1 Tax=Acidianus sulfidivorans JP7 TaxID=619593 RepID=A0A2U9IPP1_9CREN|nr:ATP-binding protein [Acidianus sulfidivorans]AWR97981.1 AAA family ATPase [Acidianus sulfidivorans JP7]